METPSSIFSDHKLAQATENTVFFIQACKTICEHSELPCNATNLSLVGQVLITFLLQQELSTVVESKNNENKWEETDEGNGEIII